MDKYKIKLFYADWCGHCRNFKPIWTEFKNFLKVNPNLKDKDNKSISIVTEEFDDSNNMEATLEKVEGFPTIIVYKNTIERDVYNGERTLNGLKKYFNLSTDSLNQKGGNLNYYNKYMKYKLKYLQLKNN